MILLTIVLPVLSILFSLVALIVGCVALAFVIGLKNSTHQVVWKPVDPFTDATAEVEEEEEKSFEPFENPNKRIKKEEKEEPFLDLDDPNITANKW